VVLDFNKATDIPATTMTDDSLFKYFSTDSQVSTQYVELNFDLQAGSTGSDWTTVKEFARTIGKDTLPDTMDVPFPSGIQGTFRYPSHAGNYRRVVMKTYGGDSTCAFNMVVGLSRDRFFGDLTTQGS